MINNKKKINKIKTQEFFDEFSIKFLLQQNNFSVKDWLELRQRIQEISENSVKILNVKNSLLKKSLLQKKEFAQNVGSSCSQFSIWEQNLGPPFFRKTANAQEKWNSLCQGPNFIIGCKTTNHLKPIWNYLNSNSKLIFISCFYKDQLLNHLDLEIFLKTDFSIYSNLFQILDKKTELSNTLQYHLKMHPLFLIQTNPITVLENLKQFKTIK